ncbi:MAG: hypothetical protein P8P74_03085 [Crocinitomicaceae bacterium]|nr:hypothetical protein [Crocinitomicaceae bacterium]
MDSRLKRIKELDNGSHAVKKSYLAKKSEGGRYLKLRIFRPFLKLKYKRFRKRIESAPWLTITAIRFFDDFLDGSHVGAEFGTGASTAFFARRTKKLVSIEHDKAWYEKTKEELAKNSISDNVDYFLLEKQDPSSTETVSSLFPGVTGLEGYNYRKDYENYFKGLDTYPDESFDFIIVDGRARPECVFRSLHKLKKDGMMVLDNSERDRYKVVFNYLKDWEMINTTTGLTDTTFWIKP